MELNKVYGSFIIILEELKETQEFFHEGKHMHSYLL